MYYNGCFFTKNPSQALSGKTALSGLGQKLLGSAETLVRVSSASPLKSDTGLDSAPILSAASSLFLEMLHLLEWHQVILCAMEDQGRLRQVTLVDHGVLGRGLS